jgi:hypothetical protein
MASGVSITASVQGLDGVLNRMKRARSTVTTETTRSLNSAIAQGRRTVQAGTPVRTGKAKAGWVTRQTGPLARELYNPVFYVPFLVLGTRYMFPVKALNDALDKAAKDMDKTLGDTGSRIAVELTKG